MNQDIIDLYDRVPAKTKIVVTSNVGAPMVASVDAQAIPIDNGVPQGTLLGRTWF